MPTRTLILLVLAVPVAVVAYLVTQGIVVALALPDGLQGLAVLFLPLLAGGLAAIPFLAPFVDHKAKQALADRPPRPDDRT